MFTNSQPETHPFKKKLEEGNYFESILDGYYGKWYEIQKISEQAQRNGIDRVWTQKNTGFRYTVEYKSDSRASETNHVFIETVSVDTQNKKGWAYTSCAQILIYYIPPHNKAYRMTVITLKNLVVAWKEKYKEVSSPNDGYNTLGLRVPLNEFIRYCYRADEIGREER